MICWYVFSSLEGRMPTNSLVGMFPFMCGSSCCCFSSICGSRCFLFVEKKHVLPSHLCIRYNGTSLTLWQSQQKQREINIKIFLHTTMYGYHNIHCTITFQGILDNCSIYDHHKANVTQYNKMYYMSTLLHYLTEVLTSFPIIPNSDKLKWYSWKYNFYKSVYFLFLYILHTI